MKSERSEAWPSRQSGGLEIASSNLAALTMETEQQERLTQVIYSVVQPHKADKHVLRINRIFRQGFYNYIIIEKAYKGRVMIRISPNCAIKFIIGLSRRNHESNCEVHMSDPDLFERIEKLIGPVV